MFPTAGNTGAAPPSSLAPLPPGWTAYMDAKHSREYYHHAATGSTQWIRPTPPPAPAPAPAVPPPQPPQPIAPLHNVRPLVQNRLIQNHNAQQRPPWQFATGQTPPSVTPYSVQPMPQFQQQPQPQHNYNANQVSSQYPPTQGPPPNNTWSNPKPQQNDYTQQTNFNPQQNPQQNNFNFNPQPTTHFNPPNMLPQPPDLSHVHNTQWRPKRLRLPPHHNNNGGNFQHQNNDFHPNKRLCFQQHQIQPQYKKCSKCGGSKPFEFFSKRQWNLADFKRMCRSCVDDAVRANEAAMKSATLGAAAATHPPPMASSALGRNAMKACSSCHKVLPEEGFSKRQWTLTGTLRKCKSCVDVVVKENEANMASVSEKAKVEKRTKYEEKGSALECQPADDKVDTPSKEENEGGPEKEQPSGDAPHAAEEDGNVESDCRSITVSATVAVTPAPNVGGRGDKTLKICSACQKCLASIAFSKRQWTASASVRKCKACVDKFLQQYPAMQKEAALEGQPWACGGRPGAGAQLVLQGAQPGDGAGAGRREQLGGGPQMVGGSQVGAGTYGQRLNPAQGGAGAQPVVGPQHRGGAQPEDGALPIKESTANGVAVENNGDDNPVEEMTGTVPEILVATAELKRCCKCNMRLSEASFTPAEWAKDKGLQRQCNFCAGNPLKPSTLAMVADGTSMKFCSSCKVFLPMESYSKRQWSQARTDVRKCKACVDKFLVEYPSRQREEALAAKRRAYVAKESQLDQVVVQMPKPSQEIGESQLGHFTTGALKISGEKEVSINKNVKGDELKCAEEKDQGEDACQSINIDIIISNEYGNAGDEDAGVKLECKSNDPMPVKEESQPEQAVEVVHEIKSEIAESNPAMPLKEEPQPAQVVDDDALKLSEKAVADDALESSEHAVADDSLKSSEQAVADDALAPSEQKVADDSFKSSEQAMVDDAVESSEQVMADDALKPSEQAVADDAPQSSKNEASVDENHSGPEAAYEKGKSEPANQSHISSGADVTVTTGSKGLADSNLGDADIGMPKTANAAIVPDSIQQQPCCRMESGDA